MYSLQQIAEITNSKFIGANNKATFFLNDSRALQSPADKLFIALKTNRNNGHNYIPDLIEKGVRSFLIQEREFDITKFKNADVSFIISAVISIGAGLSQQAPLKCNISRPILPSSYLNHPNLFSDESLPFAN